MGACSNNTRALFAGGTTGSNQDEMEYVTITSTGNVTDFGDLTVAIANLSGASNGHGGLS